MKHLDANPLPGPLTLVLVLALLLPSAASAQCIDYGDYLHHAATMTLPGTAVRRIAAEGDLVVIAAGSIGLEILSVADPANPALITTFDTPGTCQDVRLRGSVAYVSDGTLGIQIIDLINPASPQIVGNWDPGSVSVLDIEGSTMAVQGTAGFYLLDLVHPFAPALVGSCAGPAVGLDLALDGGRAYLAGYDGLRIVDLSVPATPAVIGFHAASTFGDIVAVEAAGDIVYLVDNPAGDEFGLFATLDVSNPASPVVIAELGFYYASDLAVAGPIACVMDGGYGPQLHDVADPANPIGVLGMSGLNFAYRVEMSDGNCYVAGSGYFGIIVVPSLVPPPELNLIPTPSSDLKIIGDRLVTVGLEGLVTWSLADPAAPVMLATRPIGGYHLDVAGSLAAVTGEAGGLQLVDVSNMSAPVLRSVANTPGDARDVLLSGNYAYVADGPAGLTVVLVAQPATPQVMTTIDTPGQAAGLALDGPYLYLADLYAGLRIFDISSPASPLLLGSVSLSGIDNVVVQGGYAFVADGSALTVIDVSIPSAPRIIARLWTTGGMSEGLWLDGDVLYVGGSSELLYLFDVANPAEPRPIGMHSGQGEDVTGLAMTATMIFATDWQGIHLLPISCTTSGAPEPPVTSSALRILPAFPNPSTDRVEFVIELSEGTLAGEDHTDTSGRVLEGVVVNVSGRIVHRCPRVVALGRQARLAWDGRDDAGSPCASGIYYLRVSSSPGTATRQFLRVR